MDNILIIKHGALGDVVRTTYLIKSIFEKFKNPQIYWFTSKNSYPLLRFNPYIFNIIVDSNDLTNIKFDWVISLDDEFEILNALKEISFSKLTGSYLIDGEKKYTSDSSLWFDMGLISVFGKAQADTLKKENKLSHDTIFSKVLNIRQINPCFYNSFLIEEKFIRKKIDKYFYIGLNTGAGGRWKSKQLPIPESVSLVKKLLDFNIGNKECMIILLGGEDELNRNNMIIEMNDFNQRIMYQDTSSSLLSFAALIKSMDYIITSDSLALHLAISQSIPNLSFYAPTSAAEINTFGTGVKLKSTGSDYCNYSSECDNSSFTAKRIFGEFKKHISTLNIK